MLRLPDIRLLHIELTTKCNARCPMCMRNYRGLDYNSGYPECELSIDQFKHIVTPDLLKQISSDHNHGFKHGINFNGNLGDFASATDALEIVTYVSEYNVPIYINTNGSSRNTTWWSKLAIPQVTVGFALDGLADTHHLYRQDTNWHKIIANATAFIAAGGHAQWRFAPFDHNRHQENQCRELAQSLGFSQFENIWDGRDTGPVFDRHGNFSHHLGKSQAHDQSVPKVQPLLESHITWYDSKTVKHTKDTSTLDMFCQHKVYKEIYIAANGSVYPCCYLGFYPHTMHHPGNKELAPMVTENNALIHPLEHCLQWFDKVEQTWQQPSIAQGRTYQCVVSCNRNINDIS